MADNQNLHPLRSKSHQANSPISHSTKSLGSISNEGKHGRAEAACSQLDAHSREGETVGKDRSGEQADDEDVLSAFGITQNHFLRKAVSTTFKTVSDKVKFNTQYFYADGSSEEVVAGQDSRGSHSADHQPRTLHRISNSLSRSGARFVSSFKNWHPRESNGNPLGFNLPDHSSGDFIVDPTDSGNGYGHPLIDVKIPNPTIPLNLDYPWISLSAPEPPRKRSAIRPCSSKRSSIERFLGLRSTETQASNPHIPLQEMSTHAEPLTKPQTPKLQLDTNLASQTNARFSIKRKYGQNVRFADAGRTSSPYDADIESGESEVSGALDSSTRNTLSEWTKRRENRKNRYEVISSMSPLRPSLDADSTITTTFVDSDDSSFRPKGSLELMMRKSEHPDYEGPVSSNESSNNTYPDATTAVSVDASDSPADITLCPRQQFPSYAIEAAERQNGFDLDERASRTLSQRPRYTIVEEVAAIELPSIDSTLKAKSKSRPSVMESLARSSRPSFSRQVSVLSNNSADSCALTSKSSLRVTDVEGSAEHHRRAPDNQDETAKERVRKTLNHVCEDERSFVVDAPSDQSFNLGPKGDLSLSSASERYSDRMSEQSHGQDCEWDNNESSDEECRQRRKSAPIILCRRTGTSGSCYSPASKSGVSFILPDDYSPSEKVSKHYRRPSPCPYGRSSPSKIPAPTYESPTASSRKSIPLVRRLSEISEDLNTSADDTSIKMSPKANFVAARLPAFRSYTDRRDIGSSETDFFTAIEGKNGSQQDEDPFSPDDTLTRFIDSDSAAARPVSPRGPWSNANLDTRPRLNTARKVAEGNLEHVSPVDSVSRISFSTATSSTIVTPTEPASQIWSRKSSRDEPDMRRMPGHLPSSSEETIDGDEVLHEYQEEGDEGLEQKEEDEVDTNFQLEDALGRHPSLSRRDSRVFHGAGPRIRWSPVKAKRSLEF
ncbi:hypothetical protein MMC10_008356 [Thelotrema lepadinum]|nr:hypothetical protein [Thelotrema lepadinum]